MVVIKITGCTNGEWYEKRIGEFAPMLGMWPEGYKTLDDSGYLNVVYYKDAEVWMMTHDGLRLKFDVSQLK
jgi:hypothetical protein